MLHQPTIFLSISLVYGALTLATLPVWRLFRVTRGLNGWLYGNLLMSMALFLLSQRGQWPNFWTMVVPALGVFAGLLSFHAALLQLYQLNRKWLRSLSIPLAAGVASVVLWHRDQSPGQVQLAHLRMSVVALGILWIAGGILHTIWHNAPRPFSLGTRYLLVAMSLPVVMGVLRLSYFLLIPLGKDPVLHTTPVHGLLGLLCAVCSTMAMTYGILLSLQEQEQMALQTRNALLQQASLLDPLTGVANRRQLAETAGQEVARARRIGSPLAVLVLDLDHFKQINDQFGHAIGDEVLCETASLCQSALRSSDLVARLGGEEFAILLPHTDASGAAVLGRRLLRMIEAARFAGVVGRPVTASLGLAMWQPGEPSIDAALQRADAALYRAKAAGRNRLHAATDAEVALNAPLAATT